LLWEEKLAKYHVEDVKDYNGEERRHLYIDCHYLLQYFSISLWIISALLQDLKQNENTKEKKRKEEHVHYTKREKTHPTH